MATSAQQSCFGFVLKGALIGMVLLSLSGCNWLKEIAKIEREVAFSVSINPGEIYEGQQAKVSVKLMMDYAEVKNVSWSLHEKTSETLASETDFLEPSGVLSLLGTAPQSFMITSKPGSVLNGSKSYKLVMASDGVRSEFDLIVKSSGTSSTISITSAQNSGYVNSANQSNYTVSGVCSSVGSDVSLVAKIGVESASGTTVCSAGLTWSVPLDFSSMAGEGAVQLTATHAGTAGSIAATTLQITKDVQPPVMTIDSPVAMSSINFTASTGFSISGTCSEVGRIVTATLSSTGGGSPVPMSALCLEIMGVGQWNATSNITSLNDGIITANFTHNDFAGNEVSVARSFSKDTVVPVFAITSPTPNSIFNAANYASLTISGTCNKAGATLSLSGDVSGTLSATCDGTNFSLAGLTLAGADGNKAITATLSDPAGNSTQAVLALRKDISIPTISIVTPIAATIYNAANYGSLAVSGTCNESGATVTLSGDVSGTLTTSCDGSAFNLSGLTLTGPSGTKSITATISDPASNSAQVSVSLEKDIFVPSITIAVPTAAQIFNTSSYQAVSVSGTCDKTGATVTASGPLSGTLTTTCNGTSYSLAGLSLTGVDGSKDLKVKIEDTAGNSSEATVSVALDITIPLATLSGAPGPFSNALNLNVTVGGSDVSQYIYKAGDGASIDCSNATGYSAPISIATLITNALGSDGSKRLCVRGVDASGNIQELANATQVDWVKDVVAPVLAITSPNAGSYVNRLAQSSFAINGTCSEAGSQNVNLDGDIAGPIKVDCVSGSPDNTWAANLDFSGASDGPVFVLVSQADAAGNVGSRTRAFVKSSVDPVIAFTSPNAGSDINNSNKTSFTVSGTCSTYSATPNIILTGTSLSSSVSVACDGTNWTANLAFINGDGSVSVKATITDVAGNTGEATRSFNKDTTNPVLAVTSPSSGSYVNDANKASFAVSGTCSDVGSNNVVISGAATATTNCVSNTPNNTWSANLNFTSASDGALSITVTHKDAAGNTHAPTFALNKDTVSPNVDWTLPLASACASDASATSFAVSGTCTTADGDVTLSSSQLGSNVTVGCVGNQWDAILNLNITSLGDFDPFDVQARQTDVAGNIRNVTRNFKKVGSNPSVILGGWNDIYSVGAKTFAANPSEVTPSAESGVVRIGWKEWPGGNSCMPDAVKVYRASSSGGMGTLVSGTDFPSGIPANVRTFTDTSLAPGDFAKGWYYKLKVSIAGQDYDVLSPAEIAEVRVVAPPDNMALMHRWIANQEVCGLMGRTPDQSNHYRCSYSGLGKILGNFYDLSQDTLIDRHELACNFTSQCGGNKDQPCLATEFTTLRPDTSNIGGDDGQVFYNNDGTDAKCWIKIAGTWREANTTNAALTPVLRAVMSTPMAHKPPLVRIDQSRSYETCQGHTVTLDQVPGFTTESKRLLRSIEWKAAAAWSTTMDSTGFANYDLFLARLETGGNTGADVGRCNSSNAHGSIVTDRGYVGTLAFYAGSQTATAQCQSRYGVQDMVGNVWEWTSDQLANCSPQGFTCEGIVPVVWNGSTPTANPMDAGNTFMNGFIFDDDVAPGSGLVTDWTIESKTYGADYFSVPLGIPFKVSDSGNAIDINTWISPTNKFHGDRFYFQPGNGNASRGVLVGGSRDGSPGVPLAS